MSEKFSADKKAGSSILTNYENRLKEWAVPKVPQFAETYHLTMLTLVWSIANVIVAFWAKENLNWLWFVSLMIVFQYITDVLDGAVGRRRNTGLIRWGYYMDHFLDYIFLCSLVFVGYMISPEGLEIWYFALLVIVGSYMVNSFLSFAATNEFKIYYYGIGPTEGRIIIILINVFIVIFGTDSFHILLPLTCLVCFLGLIINTYQIQKRLWSIDMAAKNKQKSS